MMRFALTLAIAIAGGTLAWLISMPAPWLAGSMLVVAGASLAGADLRLPEPVRHATFIVLGAQVGSAFTWDSLANAAQWPVSLICLIATIAALIASGFVLLTRVFKWAPMTAFFASNPGALSMTMALAEHYRADLQQVPAVQVVRLTLLVAFIPLFASGLNSATPAPVPGALAAPLAVTALVLLMCAAAGYAFNKFGAPASYLLGAMLANAVLTLSGLADGRMPPGLLVPGFVILGIIIGLRFRNIPLASFKKMMTASFANFVVSIIIAGCGALVAAHLTGVPLLAALLAFAPGGLEVMTVLSFALGFNPAFVATHQLVRFVGLNLAMPLIANAISRRT